MVGFAIGRFMMNVVAPATGTRATVVPSGGGVGHGGCRVVGEELRRSGCTRAAATASLHDPVLADLKTCGGVAVALHAWRSLMLESSTMPINLHSR